MSKRWIWIMASFMGLAMICLIFVQSYWIRNAVTVKEGQFDQLVNKILAEVANKVQRQEAVHHIINEINPFYFDTTVSLFDNGFEIEHDFYFYQQSSDQDVNTNISVYSTDTFIIVDDRDINAENVSFDKSGRRNPQFNLNQDLKKRIVDRQTFINNIVSKMFSFNPEIEERINPVKFDAIIKEALTNKGIDLDYEYAVTKWNSILAFKSDNYMPDTEVEYYRVELFPDDFFSKSDYLTIYFPSKKNFIFKSLGYMAFSSILLTLIIVVSFSVTIFIIIRQKRYSEIRSDFVNNMTHELKTPISTISLASQMLGDKSIPLKSKNIDNLSSVITDESRRLGYQVEKVLQTAIFDKGKLELKLKESDINEIIQTVINNFSIQIKQKNGLIIPSLHAENQVIFVDVVHITNVLTNLVDNAIKYCTRDPEIYIETQDYREYLMIAVRDNGIGISKNDQKRIFDKFYRVSTGNIHSVKGFGLGLCYVKRIIEEHKGYIKLESEQYEGTIFKIFLPSKNNVLN
ncbi:MAG: HAMP domain-containing histidine kinase [Bacteroidales bacterium]|nr:MAG: HAMP domain-containing histidine kinase [Bacteroidales bacterium]